MGKFAVQRPLIGVRSVTEVSQKVDNHYTLHHDFFITFVVDSSHSDFWLCESVLDLHVAFFLKHVTM